MAAEQNSQQRKDSVDLLSQNNNDTMVNLESATPTPNTNTNIRRGSMSITAIPTTESEKKTPLPTTTDSTQKSKKDEKLQEADTFRTRHPWLMGWNSEDWWPCWIGLFLFALVSIAVRYDIPEAHFKLWSSNPFDSLHGQGNFGLLVLFPLQGLLVWLALWAIGAKAWKQFPQGYLVVYVLSFLSKWLAAQESIKSASLGDSIWAILFGTVLRNAMGGKAMPDGRSKPLAPWLKVAQQTELYIAISLVLLW
ncbi:hypothetical protein BGZ96_012187 [Linnemannia gamsii]|uniref:Uncharacterized protein n=1 Tax=Linnemannia gamsii TaxID=64522 RepID=A0ABQ7JQW7_9FUNG|nr:hypothetical protein BGZ96_012187 [Linnemannia gamsii]